MKDSLYSIRGQPPGPVCNLNSQVSDLYLDHLCLSTGDFLPKSLEPELHVVGHFFSSGEQISRSSIYCNIFPLDPRSRSRRSWLRACPNRWGLSLNPWGNTVQVICWCFSPGASHSKAKRYWNSLASGMQKKKKKKCIFEIQDCKTLGTGLDFSQDYIVGYCGLEGNTATFMIRSSWTIHQVLSFFLYWEDWGVTWRTGGDQ